VPATRPATNEIITTPVIGDTATEPAILCVMMERLTITPKAKNVFRKVNK